VIETHEQAGDFKEPREAGLLSCSVLVDVPST